MNLKQNQFNKFMEIIKFVWENSHSDFYRQKFQKANIDPFKDIKSLNDIQKIPFTTRKELAERDPLTNIFGIESEISHIATTSGTSFGDIAFFFHPYNEQLTILPQNIKKLLILAPVQRIIPFIKTSWENKIVPILGDIRNLPSAAFLVKRLKIDAIYTDPILLYFFEKYLTNFRAKIFIKTICLGSDALSENKKKVFNRQFPNAKILMGYGMSEFCRIGFQCENLAEKSSDTYHIRPDYVYYEIIDPKTNKGVSFGERGELILSSLSNYVSPLIRYKTGDLAAFSKYKCNCGLGELLIQVFGRVNQDMVKVAGFVLNREQFEDVILKLKSYLNGEFEIHIFEKDSSENYRPIKLVINLSLKQGVIDSSWLRNYVKETIINFWRISPRLSLKKAVIDGLFSMPEIQFKKEGLPAPKKILILHKI